MLHPGHLLALEEVLASFQSTTRSTCPCLSSGEGCGSCGSARWPSSFRAAFAVAGAPGFTFLGQKENSAPFPSTLQSRLQGFASYFKLESLYLLWLRDLFTRVKDSPCRKRLLEFFFKYDV